jgi:methyl-accepting chemotaxis protein
MQKNEENAEDDILVPANHLTKLNSELHILRGLINEFANNSEKNFLEIGMKLQRFSTRSNEITKIASKAIDSGSDDILQRGINELNSFLENFREYLESSTDEIRSDISVLHKILPSIEAINKQQNGFDKIVKHLRMLGISTKIESARLGTEDQGFYALADTVNKLSGLISEKTVTIINKSKFLMEELNGTIADLNILEKNLNEQSNVILTNSKRSLDAFNDKYHERMSKTENISNASNEISQNINDIVMSIQIHDITRQRMEHAKNALAEIDSKTKSLQNIDEEEIKNLLGAVYDVCCLQGDQIKNSIEEFINAIVTIVDNLKGVGENTSRILKELSILLNEDDSSQKNSLQLVRQELSSISDGLVKNTNIGIEFANSINSVISIVDDLSKYILEIEDIGSEIEIIALNARIKAARTGSNGLALGVLSENIQRLSEDAKEQTATTSKILESISQQSSNLRNSVESGCYKENNEHMITTAEKINELTLTLIELENSAKKNMENIRTGIKVLRDEIRTTIDEITIPEYAKKTLKKLTAELKNIAVELEKSGNIDSDRDTNTKNLMLNYTMHTERKIHQNFIGINENNMHADSMKKQNTENPFGDNVELF